MKKNKSQKSEILRYLKTHKRGITTFQAFELFGVTRLADIIYRLRKEDYKINSEEVTKKNRYGHTVTFARYYLVA